MSTLWQTDVSAFSPSQRIHDMIRYDDQRIHATLEEEKNGMGNENEK